MNNIFLEKYHAASAYWDHAQQQIQHLQRLNPYLVDLTIRETAASTSIGQSLEMKIAILEKIQHFGFEYILLGALNYAYPALLEVDDYFLKYLVDQNYDLKNFYVFTSIGQVEKGQFIVDPSLEKFKQYGIPNTFLEVALIDDYLLQDQAARQGFIENVIASIQWIHQLNRHSHAKIIVNFIDGCDAFLQDPQATCYLLDILAQQAIEGISIEDSRGTFMHFQMGAFIAMARIFLPQPLKLLVHVHSGNGCENASVIEALLKGADGVWGGMPKQAAVNGQASLSELLANLVRVKNQHVLTQYKMRSLLPMMHSLEHLLMDEESVDHNVSMIGKNAYKLHLSVFEQIQNRPMDLVPEDIGGHYSYRICPVVSDIQVIRHRLKEVLQDSEFDCADHIILKMIAQMRDDLNQGRLIEYDNPMILKRLFQKIKTDDSSDVKSSVKNMILS